MPSLQMIHFNGLTDLQKWTGWLAAAEKTGEIPVRRVKVEQDGFDALQAERVEFLDWRVAGPG